MSLTKREFDRLVEDLADQVSKRMARGDFSREHYGLCIHVVCQRSPKLKRAVGRLLQKRGEIQKKINKVKAEEAQEQKPVQGRLF